MFFNRKKILDKPVMYVKTKDLKVSSEIQKDVDVKRIFSDSIKYYDNEKRAQKDGYTKAGLLLIVRTVYTNKVLCFSDKDKGSIPYIISKDIAPYPHKDLDLLMYLSSISLFNRVEYREGFDEVMLYSEFQFNGVFNPNIDFIIPLFVCTIYLDDSRESDFLTFCKDSVEWVPISTVKSAHNCNVLGGIINSLTEVIKKEDSKDDKCNDTI